MQLTETKTAHPADNQSPRWTVTGPAGSVRFDTLGSKLAVLNPAGEAVGFLSARSTDEARSVSEYYDDNTMFRLLGDHYDKHLAGR